jgi:hypothetical protein
MDALNDAGTNFALVTVLGGTAFYLLQATVNEQSDGDKLRIFYFLFGIGLMYLSIRIMGSKPNIMSVRSLVLIFGLTGFCFIRGMIKNKNEGGLIRGLYFGLGIIAFSFAIGMTGVQI